MADATQAPPQTGTFCWNELMTPDTEAARSFYQELFGWTSRDVDMGDYGTYTIFSSGEKDIGGMCALSKEDVPPHWMSYVAVDDVDAATEKAEQLGGMQCVPPTDIPEVGRFSVITDPSGATIALYKQAK